MKDSLIVILTVLGGLGAFLLGMKHLSEGLQAISGKGLRRFMSLATTNRFAGMTTGIVSTVIVQSSSIITVMVVGFVSSGMLNLTQAINVIIGSNIGTTTTAWIIAYAPDVRLLGLGVVSVGAVCYFFVKREFWHNFGLALMGLGFIFMGLYWIKEGVEPVKSNPAVVEAFKSLDAKNLAGLLKCVLVSMVFTAVVQSSAATTAIAMALATQGLITFEAAAATVFGMNIGTTVTAWMAAFNSTTEARRTAMAHTIFNVAGTILLIPLFIPVIIPIAKELFPRYATEIPAPMAAVHTFFNVATTLVFIPFVRYFAKFVEWLVPAKKKEPPRLTVLNPKVRQSPVIALDQASREVAFMAESDLSLLGNVRRVIEGTAIEREEEHIFKRESILDKVQGEITEFIGVVMMSRLPKDVAERARMLLRLADEFESVSDEAPMILKTIRRMRESGQKMSAVSVAAILAVHDRAAAFGEAVSTALKAEGSKILTANIQPILNESSELRAFIRETRRQQLSRLGGDEAAPMRVLIELDILSAYDRMRSCYENIADALLGGKGRATAT